jgi:hypothetical protein
VCFYFVKFKTSKKRKRNEEWVFLDEVATSWHLVIVRNLRQFKEKYIFLSFLRFNTKMSLNHVSLARIGFFGFLGNRQARLVRLLKTAS